MLHPYYKAFWPPYELSKKLQYIHQNKIKCVCEKEVSYVLILCSLQDMSNKMQ